MQISRNEILNVCVEDAFDTANCPVVGITSFRNTVIDRVSKGNRIAAFFGIPAEERSIKLICVLADDETGSLRVISSIVEGSYPSFTRECPQAHLFEREICEQCNIVPKNHPWLKPIRFHSAGHKYGPYKPAASIKDFFTMQGEEVHEVAVGPVHAGIIEPGHFRFQCHGETVYHLEIALGYQHRGVERALIGGPNARTDHYIETLCGDSTIGHMIAGCSLIEKLAGIKVPARGQTIRAIAAELERIANHIGDLGALSGDVGFLPTMSYCGRIRGDVLNITAEICGNRFGRGLVIPGGTAWNIASEQIEDLLKRLSNVEKDVTSAVELMFDTPSVLARLENTGRVSKKTASEIGMVGLAARASGLERDVRVQHPYEIYNFTSVNMFTWNTGDCFARAYLRWLEVQESLTIVRALLESMPAGIPANPWNGKLNPGKTAIVLTEGWRGEICHVAGTNSFGKFSFYKVVDPSFHNWFGLTLSLRNEQISDFPLCNKSFNLSYCGHDL
ncbi:MAG: NADH-quinone oxidoreductase subunit C [Deltaproteobacteria bacterium]|nr:NADH-quinone oxidoreductase subunit C [Deltaproteobacteria bacterium]MBW2661006.1 NADH-quinone oxidoreductase subunit C [Deltaproteobacteria bacterium]